jgi:hypothetical protein
MALMGGIVALGGASVPGFRRRNAGMPVIARPMIRCGFVGVLGALVIARAINILK